MGRGSGGGSRVGGIQISAGFRRGTSVPANRSSFRVGDTVRTPGTSRSSPIVGRVTNVGRSRVTLTVGSYGGDVNISFSASDLSGGHRVRGNAVSPIR